jgi:hypothetical protein
MTPDLTRVNPSGSAGWHQACNNSDANQELGDACDCKRIVTHPEGELATARGAAAAGATMVLSSFSNVCLEDVAAVAKSPLWFQLFSQPDHGFMRLSAVLTGQCFGFKTS